MTNRHSSIPELGELIELITVRDGTYRPIEAQAVKLASCLVEMTDIEGDEHLEGYSKTDMIGARKLLKDLLDYVRLVDPPTQYNRYVGVVAESSELARKYAVDHGLSRDYMELVHRELPTNKEESPTFIFRVFDPNYQIPTYPETLHEHFNLTGLVDMPYEQI